MVYESKIRTKAYDIWEQAGRPDEGHQEHWRQASDQLNAEESAGDLAVGGVEVGAAGSVDKLIKPKR